MDKFRHGSCVVKKCLRNAIFTFHLAVFSWGWLTTIFGQAIESIFEKNSPISPESDSTMKYPG